MLAGTRPARRPRGSTFLSLTAAVAVATVLLARTASGCPTTSAVSGLDGTAYACSESDGNECTLTPGSLIDLTVTFSKESVGSAYNLQETHPEPVAMVAPCSSGVHHNVDERGLRKRSLRLLKMVENGPQERTRANCRVHLDKATRYRSAALRTQQEPASAPGVPPTSALFIVAASSAWNKFRAGESKFCWWLIFFFVHPGFARPSRKCTRFIDIFPLFLVLSLLIHNVESWWSVDLCWPLKGGVRRAGLPGSSQGKASIYPVRFADIWRLSSSPLASFVSFLKTLHACPSRPLLGRVL